MGFWSSIGSAVLGGAVGKAFSPKDNSARNLRLGNELDMANQKEMFDYRISQGKAAGMTDYEMFMGPAGAGGGGTTGSGGTLGNAENQRNIAQTQRNQEMIQKALDRETQLKQTEMQTDAQVKTAEIAAGQSRYNTDQSVDQQRYNTDQTIGLGTKNYDLKAREFNEVTIKRAGEALKLTKAQTQKALNDAQTSAPSFVKFMKMLSMGTDNVLATAIQNFQGVNLVDPKSVSKLSPDQRKSIMTQILAIQSGSYKNLQGIKQGVSDWYDQWNPLKNPVTMGNKPKSHEGPTPGYRTGGGF